MHTTGKEFWRDDDGFIAAGKGDEYVTIATFNCSNDIDIAEREANIKRTISLLNAANGMTTEEAVRYLEYGREMEQAITSMRNMMEEQIDNKVRGGRGQFVKTFQTALDTFNNLLAKLEGK